MKFVDSSTTYKASFKKLQCTSQSREKISLVIERESLEIHLKFNGLCYTLIRKLILEVQNQSLCHPQ